MSFNENTSLRMTTRSQTNKLKEEEKENRRLESTKKRLIDKEVYWSNMFEQEAFDCDSDNTDNSCLDQILVYKVEIPVKHHNLPECIKAKKIELDNLKNFDTFTKIIDNGQNMIDARWVMHQKEKQDGQKQMRKA